MGYHLTILRTRRGKPQPISFAEVAAAVEGQDGWRHTDTPPSVEFQGEAGGLTLWYQDGELWARNPEPWQIGVMVALARQLNGRVRGDELETYRSETDTYHHPDDKVLLDAQAAASDQYLSKARRRRRLFRAYQIVTTSILLLAAVLWLIRRL